MPAGAGAPGAAPPAPGPGPGLPPAGGGSGFWLLGLGTPGNAAHALAGAFRRRPGQDAALVSARHVQLFGDAGAGRVALACVHPVHAAVRDARTLPRPELDQASGGPPP
jgi:hypothetical protein